MVAHIGVVQSSIMHLVLIAGLALILPLFIRRETPWHRAVLMGIAALLAFRYGYWRATETLAPPGLTVSCIASWSLFALEALSLIGSMSAFTMMSRIRERSEEATANLGWWGKGPVPRVAVMIATYNEELEVLERTIIGAKSLRHPNTEVMILDDGRRDWLRDYCETQKVRYVRRPDNKGSKAGNINHALALVDTDPVPPDFVAVLDADFVPHRGFLSRSLALFHDPKVGLVQTPQHFFNPDPIQHNLGLDRSYPDEQRFFFDHMQPARDGWGIAFCCGTSSVARMAAVREIGGFPTESITEDFMLTLDLQNAGWKSVYLNEALTEGLAPEGLKEYVTQRARWCLGLMQIARSRLGPFAKNNLRIRDRWSVLDSVFYWITTFPFRLASVVYPLLYWYFNVTVVDATVADVIDYFGCYYLWVIISLNLMSRGLIVPIANDVSQLIGAIPISRAAIVGLIKPHGHPFSVTAKGGDRSKVVVQWAMMRPFLILFVLTLVGVVIGMVSDRFAYYDAGDGKAVVLFWTLYNLVLLFVALIVCVELPRQESHVTDQPERSGFVHEGRVVPVWITGLTRDTVRIRGHRFRVGDRGFLRIQDVGLVEAYVMAGTSDGARLKITPDEKQYEALNLRFYAEDNTPGITSVRLGVMLRDAARRLTTGSGDDDRS